MPSGLTLHTMDEIKSAKAAREGADDMDCTVRAVAACCNLPYADAFAHLASYGRKPGCRFMFESAISRGLLADLGYTHKYISTPARTIRTAARYHNAGRFFFGVRGHVAGAVHGKVYDWAEGRLHRIEYVMQLFNEKEMIRL